MAKVENVDVPGVFQLENGLWGYRFTITVNGKKKDVKKTKDDSMKKLLKKHVKNQYYLYLLLL